MSGLYVVFEVSGDAYLLPALRVLQLEGWKGATRVPGAPAWVSGLLQVRGRVVPVIDLYLRFGGSGQPERPEARVVVAMLGDTGARAVGLLADRARQVIRLDDGALHPPPPEVTEQSAGFVRAVARQDERILMLIDLERVVDAAALPALIGAGEE